MERKIYIKCDFEAEDILNEIWNEKTYIKWDMEREEIY